MFGGFLKFMKHRPYGDILGLTTNFKLPINFFLSILTIMMHETNLINKKNHLQHFKKRNRIQIFGNSLLEWNRE
jgi:hypothetical protein